MTEVAYRGVKNIGQKRGRFVGQSVEYNEIVRLFRQLEAERVPALRRMGDSIVKDLSLKLDRAFDQVEAAIAETLKARPTDAQRL